MVIFFLNQSIPSKNQQYWLNQHFPAGRLGVGFPNINILFQKNVLLLYLK